MARNGSGVMSVPHSNFEAGTVIDSEQMDANFATIVNELTNSLPRDGQAAPTANLPMGGYKLTGLGDGTSNTDSVTLGQVKNLSSPYVNDFRLTLTSGTPVTTADVTGASTIYLTPYKGKSVSLYVDGGFSCFQMDSVAFSIAPAYYLADRVFDLFLYADNGVPTVQCYRWDTNTSRGSFDLTRRDGVLTLTSDPTRRYMGTFGTTLQGQSEDSLRRRLLYNEDNPVARTVLRKETASYWTYTDPTRRQANGNALNQIDLVVGTSKNPVDVTLNYCLANTNASVYAGGYIGVDSVSGGSPDATNSSTRTQVANVEINGVSHLSKILTPGLHRITWIESSVNSGTTSFIGGASSGLSGFVFA